MSTLVPNSPQRDSSSFRKVVAAFLSGEGLPFKLSEEALHELSCEVAAELEEAADPSWLWKDRHSDFWRGKRLGKYDHLIVWTRPPRPEWMDEQTYARLPETLVLREIRYNIVEPGRRTRTIDIITTLSPA